MPQPSNKDERARRHERFRMVSRGQSDIFMNQVLFTPPGFTLDLKRLLEERNGLLLAEAKEFRSWLQEHPDQWIPGPDEEDPAELSCNQP